MGPTQSLQKHHGEFATTPRQMGIGSVPDAALSQLTNHRNLGIHTERVFALRAETVVVGRRDVGIGVVGMEK